MEAVDFPTNDNVLVGLATGDDAGIYRISDELALIQTLDFFTPVVDDPFDFGRIAAANALSDVYAMGGSPKTAMNIVAYPLENMGASVLKEILAGGAAAVKEAGAVVVGGHSVEDEELKYGLSVTGFVHPDKVLTNQGLRCGDGLVLTKPLGTGIVNTAIKGGLATEKTCQRVTKIMATLNRVAAEVAKNYDISACTDITGFGFLGHLAEMVTGTGRGVVIDSSQIPVINEAIEFASMGFVPIGAHKNRQFRKDTIKTAQDFDPVLRDILFDPQTSGGLLLGCPERDVESLVKRLHDTGVEEATCVGRVVDDKKNIIHLQ